MVRMASLKKRKQVYVVVYAFAAATCDGIYPKSTNLMTRKWEGLKRTENRGKKNDVAADQDISGLTESEATSMCNRAVVEANDVEISSTNAVGDARSPMPFSGSNTAIPSTLAPENTPSCVHKGHFAVENATNDLPQSPLKPQQYCVRHQ
ncbi:hypothetical protein V7S43_002096 [Phytophthora oleae]|uniref:Uncharacterized protein n=1 Tax=Phytophthora oleae TaxID=2107226 RepID=A0ABD3G2F5_9STRA